jgi:hypothetical protein
MAATPPCPDADYAPAHVGFVIHLTKLTKNQYCGGWLAIKASDSGHAFHQSNNSNGVETAKFLQGNIAIGRYPITLQATSTVTGSQDERTTP